MSHQIRDIAQLRDAPAYGVTAVQSFLAVESALVSVLRHIPYCDAHKAVWSPALAQIILEAASQVDSIWKAVTAAGGNNDRLTITNHFEAFGKLVAKQRVVFFGGISPIDICPFDGWESPGYTPLRWWTAYTQLKHDRFSNQSDATLESALDATAALLLAIIYSGACDLAFIAATLLDTDGHNPWAYTNTGLIRDIKFECRAKIETATFAHPLGIFQAADCNLSNYWYCKSQRFAIWWR